MDKEVARDLGEEILLGGNIRILQEAVPRLGEVDENGIERLLIGIHDIDVADGMRFHEGLSFPMNNVIACVGTQGPAPVFEQMGLEQITADKVGSKPPKAGKEGPRLIVLRSGFHTSTPGIYAIGAAISPAYALACKDGTLQRQKHTDLIYTAIRDGIQAIEDIARRNR